MAELVDADTAAMGLAVSIFVTGGVKKSDHIHEDFF